MKNIALFISLIFISCFSNNESDEGLLYAKRMDNNMYAYFNAEGKKVLGDYYAVYTDTMKDYAIVSGSGHVLIDRKGNIVYHIFTFDNGPDETSDGYYRIVENRKIGYVDSATSTLVIPPIYDCAWPFENGKAKVSNECTETSDGEHSTWHSTKWFYIDKKGNVIKE